MTTPSNELTRRQITVIMDEIERLTIELIRAGVDPHQREDKEAKVVLKQIMERAYGGWE